MVNAQKWKKWTIGELISRTKTTIQTGPFGTVLSASEFVDYGIPIISVREIREGFIRITAETPCITDGTYSRLRKYALSEKDIVFARKGSVERSALIPIGLERYFLGSDGIRIRFDQNIVSPDLMLYLFQSPSTKQFLIQSSYGTTMAGLNEKILCALEFYLPETVDEQKRIAKVLTDIDHLLALTEKLIAKKKAIKQGVMQELLTGKHRLPGFSGEWETFVFGDLFDFISNNAFTLLDFIISQEDKLKSEQKGEQESAAETIENNIRKKVVERMVINPAYYAKMSEILEQLILDRRRGVIAYGQLLDTYMELAKNVAKPEENTKYPESIRSNGALRALYDNCGEDEATALKLHKAIVKARLDGFRNNPVKANKIKRALYQLLNDDSEVERIYQIVVEQEEY